MATSGFRRRLRVLGLGFRLRVIEGLGFGFRVVEGLGFWVIEGLKVSGLGLGF